MQEDLSNWEEDPKHWVEEAVMPKGSPNHSDSEQVTLSMMGALGGTVLTGMILASEQTTLNPALEVGIAAGTGAVIGAGMYNVIKWVALHHMSRDEYDQLRGAHK